MQKNSKYSFGRPTVSVVTATFNYGQFIRDAVTSVIEQTFDDWEMIIIDDGSSDDTRKSLAPMLSDKRINYFFQNNRGQPVAKNLGIKKASGQYIAFLDADDMWHPRKLEKQLPLFRNKNIGLTYTGFIKIDPSGKKIAESVCKCLRGKLFKESLVETIPPFSSVIVPRHIFDVIGMFNENIPMAIDYELWSRLAMKYEMDFLDEPLLMYRTGHSSISSNFIQRRKLVINYIVPHILNDCGGREYLNAKEVREVYAMLYANMGNNDIMSRRWSAVKWFCRSIVAAPWMLNGYKGLLRSCMSYALASRLKRIVKTTKFIGSFR